MDLPNSLVIETEQNTEQKLSLDMMLSHLKLVHIPIMWRTGFDSQAGIFSSTTTSRRDPSPTQSPIQWLSGAPSPRVKRLGNEADHSPPPTAEVKNAWSCMSTPPYVSMSQCLMKSVTLPHDLFLQYPFYPRISFSDSVRISSFLILVNQIVIIIKLQFQGWMMNSYCVSNHPVPVAVRSKVRMALGSSDTKIMGSMFLDAWIYARALLCYDILCR
jgi:hypothetical protein